ncbi:MAG: DNA-formamidopyrimidine glycosylase [Anaerolineae bacterium]|nr:DNA-formamidopyrimidine glycosylase [Anaerolineae bacterium]
MPEGPEVQTVVNGLQACITGRRIAGVTFAGGAESMVETGADSLKAAVAGQTVAGVTRRGKYVDIVLESGMHVLLHLMMTGRLVFRDSQAAPPLDPPRFLRFVLAFDGGAELCLGDQRKWAKLVMLPAAEVARYAGIRRLGVDVLTDDFTFERFKALLDSRARLHSFLLDQARLSGLGNIYVNEALFHARLHPLRTPASLSEAEAGALFHAIYDVVRAAVAQRGTTFSDFWSPDGAPGGYQYKLQVFQREGEPCLCCGTPIARIKLGNRSAFYCPQDQPAPPDAGSPENPANSQRT